MLFPLLLTLSAGATPTSPPLDAALAKIVRPRDLPSGSAAVVAGGRVIWSRAWGPRRDDPSDPVDVDALFRIGSITKTFTALAVLQLRDAGKLDLDDPLTKWLPELRLRPHAAGDRAPTLRDVLAHRSGLPRVGALDYARADRDVTEAELLSALSVQLEATPGARYAYSNLGYAALGLVIARASGQPYRTYVTEHLLRPLGMATACWDGADVPLAHRVFGHRRRFLFFGAWQVGGTRWRMGASEAAGGLYASAPELARLALFELGDIDGPVSRASLRESQAPTQPAGKGFLGTGYGLSQLHVSGVGPVLFKNGGLENWSSSLIVDPARGVGVVLLVAGDTDEADPAAVDLLRAAEAAMPSPPSSRTTSAGPRTGSASP